MSGGGSGRFGVRMPAPECTLDEMEFMVTEIHVTDTPPPDFYYSSNTMTSASFRSSMPADDEVEPVWAREARTTVCLFATEASGCTALLRVGGFRPHLTYEMPHGRRAKLVDALAERLRVPKDSLATKPLRLKRLYGWVPDQSDPTLPRVHECVRVHFPTVWMMRKALHLGAVLGASPWEGKTDPVAMFCDQTGINPSGWVGLLSGGGGASLRSNERSSHCAVEVDCAVSALRPLEQRMDLAPLLVASVDIECYSARGSFPKAEVPEDRVAIIGVALWRVGRPIEETQTVLFCVGACAPVDGARVVACDTEEQMLDEWRDFMCVHADPDVVVGYNTFGFDYRYLNARAEMLHCRRYAYSGRVAAWRSVPAVRSLASAALGQNEMHTMGWVGRVDLDLFNYVKAQYKLPVYKLDAVAEHFLGERKVDLPYEELFRCMDGSSAEAMARACYYCAEDCRLPIKLLKRLEVLPAQVEMSRVTHTTLNQLTYRGQQIRVFNGILWHAHRNGYVLNDPPPTAGDEGYQGATVIDPTPGFYDTPVLTLDFASLYPSIMLAHNLCFSTHVIDAAHLGVEGVVYETHRPGPGKEFTFVTSTPGVLPHILRDLLGARKAAKKQMAAATDPSQKALFNARQLALKVSCNSVYGFCGAAKRGMYADVAIADSVTCLGRAMIQKTAELVVHEIPVECAVIYGDTDSVMVNVRDRAVDLQRAFELAEAAADAVSAQFRDDIVLEAEKVSLPFLLMGKKRYVAKVYEPGKAGSLVCKGVDSKGIETVRRSSSPLTKLVYNDVLEAVMERMDPLSAVEGLRANIARLVTGEVEFERFILTTEHRSADSYSNPDAMPNVSVARKIEQRSRGAIVPQTGDRLPYFVAEGPPKAKLAELAEDPTWGRQNGIKPNRLYYLEHQLVKPITAFFEAFGEDICAQVARIFDAAIAELDLQRHGQTRLTDYNITTTNTKGATSPPRRPMPDQTRLRNNNHHNKKRARKST